MNISLLEPIGVSANTITELSEGFREQGHTFTTYDSKAADPEELKARCAGNDIIMIANHPLPEEVIRAACSLKMISVAFTGVDHIDLATCREKNICVCNAAGYSNQTVAELIIGMAVHAMRNIGNGDFAVRNGGTSAGIGGREIAGRTVGIIGPGRIGLLTARLFQAFGARVIAFGRSRSSEARAQGIEFKELEEVLASSDIVSLNLPLNASTKGLLDAEKIALMKKDAVFINCARGPIVDNAALAEALNAGRLGFACVDVFDTEPPLAADDPLLHARNTLLTPHQAFISEESMKRRADIVFGNVYAYLAGRPENICR